MFVDIPSDVKIDEEIMPRRWDDEDARRELRGLDAAMMLECVGEREAAMGVRNMRTLDRAVSGEPFRMASLWCREAVEGYRWREKKPESGYPDVFTTSDRRTLAGVYGRHIMRNSLLGGPEDFDRDEPMVAKKLVLLYHDINLFNSFLPEVVSSTNPGPLVIARAQAGETGSGYNALTEHLDEVEDMIDRKLGIFGHVVFYQYAVNYAGTIYESNGRGVLTATGNQGYHSVVPFGNVRLDMWGRVRGYVLIESMHGNPLQSGHLTKRYDWVETPVSFKKDEGRFEFARGDIWAAVEAVQETFAVPVSIDTIPAASGREITQSVLELALAVDLTSRTDFTEYLTEELMREARA